MTFFTHKVSIVRTDPFWFIFAVTLLCFSAAAQDFLSPIYFTNHSAISNGRSVLTAMISEDAQRKTNVQALIGSQVVFVGGTAPPGGSANLMVWTNVLLEVQIRPARDVRPHSVVWTSEVLGTLESVDFQKRVIHIQAKPEDWIVRETR